MTDVTTGAARRRGAAAAPARRRSARLSTETRRAVTTTEFWAYVVASAAILIAGLVTSAGDGADDRLPAKETWLYFAIVTAAYVISRGLAKSGSREPYWEGGGNQERPRDEERYTR